jgi:hypothetical protein
MGGDGLSPSTRECASDESGVMLAGAHARKTEAELGAYPSRLITARQRRVSGRRAKGLCGVN